MSEEMQEYTLEELQSQKNMALKMLQETNYELAKCQAMKRLVSNPDFKEVFIDYYQDVYLKQRVDDMTLAISEQLRRSASDKVVSVGSFKQFCTDLLTKEAKLSMDIKNYEEYAQQLEELIEGAI